MPQPILGNQGPKRPKGIATREVRRHLPRPRNKPRKKARILSRNPAFEGRGKDVDATQAQPGPELSIWASAPFGPEVRKVGLVLSYQKLGVPSGRRQGEECFCDTAGSAEGLAWGRVPVWRHSEGTEIAVAPRRRFERTGVVAAPVHAEGAGGTGWPWGCWRRWTRCGRCRPRSVSSGQCCSFPGQCIFGRPS